MIGHTSQYTAARQELVGSLSAGVLFVGPPMIGKMHVARSIARDLLCKRMSVCGSCEGCAIPLDHHPDAVLFHPEPSFIDDTEERDWKKDHVRTHLLRALRRAHSRPSVGLKTVVIIEAVDRLSGDAISLLLKKIEDTLPSRVFLMTATHEEYVPRTIRSRVTTSRLSLVSADVLSDALMKERELNQRDAREYAMLSSGRPGLALRLCDDEEMRKRYQHWFMVLKTLHKLSTGEKSAFAAEFKTREQAEELLRILGDYIRAQMYTRPHPELGTIARRIREASAMMRSNVSPQLALEYVLFIPHLSRSEV